MSEKVSRYEEKLIPAKLKVLKLMTSGHQGEHQQAGLISFHFLSDSS